MSFTLVFLVGILGVCLDHGFAARDICSKFDIGGPCLLLQTNRTVTDRTFEAASTDSPYCDLACSQGNADLFSTVCQCAVVVTPATTTTLTFTTTPLLTTTPMPTTTPRPVTCYYSSQRPARLSSITRRMFSSTPVTTECDYPGVVGLFKMEKGVMQPVCMASLLDKDTLLINEKNCLTWAQKYTLYVLADSYTAADVTKSTISVVSSTAKKLDPTGTIGVLFTVQLNSSLTFNSGCIQPVCVPNINIPATDIDLDDCRVVGYGDTTDTMFSVSPKLNEIKVKVSAASVTKASLVVTRVDKIAGMACLSDDAAPVICSHKTTDEWVTVGIITTIGFTCSKAAFTKINVTSLLQEGPNKVYYNAIQGYKYANPNLFATEIE